MLLARIEFAGLGIGLARQDPVDPFDESSEKSGSRREAVVHSPRRARSRRIALAEGQSQPRSESCILPERRRSDHALFILSRRHYAGKRIDGLGSGFVKRRRETGGHRRSWRRPTGNADGRRACPTARVKCMQCTPKLPAGCIIPATATDPERSLGNGGFRHDRIPISVIAACTQGSPSSPRRPVTLVLDSRFNAAWA